jgi:hypothetical protein
MPDVDDVGAQPSDLVVQVEQVLGTALKPASFGWATKLDNDIVVAVYRDRQSVEILDCRGGQCRS